MAKKKRGLNFLIWAVIIVIVAIIGYAFYKTPAPPERPESSGRAGPSQEIPFTTIDQGVNSPVEVPAGNYVVKSLSEWEKLIPDSPAPVEFKRDMVIAVFMGEKPTGGYSVEITNISIINNQTITNIKYISPGKNCIVTQAFTSPYHIVKIQRLVLPVKFEVTKIVTQCK